MTVCHDEHASAPAALPDNNSNASHVAIRDTSRLVVDSNASYVAIRDTSRLVVDSNASYVAIDTANQRRHCFEADWMITGR